MNNEIHLLIMINVGNSQSCILRPEDFVPQEQFSKVKKFFNDKSGNTEGEMPYYIAEPLGDAIQTHLVKKERNVHEKEIMTSLNDYIIKNFTKKSNINYTDRDYTIQININNPDTNMTRKKIIKGGRRTRQRRTKTRRRGKKSVHRRTKTKTSPWFLRGGW